MLNKVIIMGRLTADPELRQTPSNISTCTFTVACDRNFVGQGQEKQADFITVVAWRQTAEFVSRYFKKGSMIVVEGGLRTRTYNDKRYPDVKHYVMEVLADQVYFGESKKSESTGNYVENRNFQAPKQEAPAPMPENTDTLTIGNTDDFEEIIGGDGDLPF
ncbi:MAG: single-stranded DNA-binding protein [Oscillospiraceae bacterium]|nr:single-stranded DNA-binding protein [Oscillospiraceae bacterium]